MDLILVRFKIDAEGAWGYLTTDWGEQICVTGSHAYLQPDGSYAPILQPGRYLCVRGTHAIEDPKPGRPDNLLQFETFEITGITGHSGVLFHFGNLPQTQSKGCELCGLAFGQLDDEEAVMQSQAAFTRLMAALIGIDQFWLTVR